MRKYIAGFRSNNKRNKIIATIYYVLTTLTFLIGSSRSLNDISLWILLMSTPSLVVNLKDLFKGSYKKEHRKIFISTLIFYMIVFAIYSATVPKIDETKADSNLLTSQEEKVDETSPKRTNNKNTSTITSENKEKESIFEVKKEENSNNKKESNTAVNNVEIHFINTGNSDSILIKDGNKAALIDGGENDDEYRVVSYLRSQNVKQLKYVIATHPDADHIGGLDAVVDEIKVENVYVSNGDANTKTYADFITSMANKGLSPSVPLLHSKFKLDKSEFEVLSVANQNDPNNNSIVLEYRNGKDKMLFMGDAGREIENTLNVSNVDLIKIGHHGSSSSSDPSFIRGIDAKYAVITCGENNRYGHPHKETMDTLRNDNIKVYRTDECGDIIFISTGNGLKTSSEEGDYKPGESSTPSNNSVYSESSNDLSKDKSGIVYWTPRGKSYHTTKSCRALKRSKVIESGTIEESGKSDPCDFCN